MQRKHFLQSILPLLTFNSINNTFSIEVAKKKIKLPNFLQKGDTVGIVSPAGNVTEKEIEGCIHKLKEIGFEVEIGDSIGKKHFGFGGTDEERLRDLQNMLNNTTIKAIYCARGGYGCVRIVDDLDWTMFIKNPKWIIGFSDITVLHSHIHEKLGFATIHGKMCSQFPTIWNDADEEQKSTLLSVFNCLQGTPNLYNAPYNLFNKIGTCTSILVGGNLKTIESLSASNSDIQTNGKILFVEDTGEALYSIDRMFYNLKRSRKLDKLAGLIVGGFKIKEEITNNAFGETIYDIVSKHTKKYNYPIAFDFPVGHQKNNYALICGGIYTLTVTEENTSLQFTQ